MKKRLMTSLAAGALMAAMLPGVASADKPAVYGPFTDTFTDFNPCTGQEMDVTLTFTFYDHEGHPNNFVGRAEVTGSTSEAAAHQSHFWPSREALAACERISVAGGDDALL